MMSRLKSRMRAQLGVTLIELMVGIAIGAITVGAGVMVYSSSSVSTSAVGELNSMDENSRTIESIVQKSFAGAGFFGCQTRNGILQNNISGAASSYLYNFAQPVYGYQSNGSGWTGSGGATSLDSSLSSASPPPLVTLHSDVLAIRSAVGPVIRLSTGSAAPGQLGNIIAAPNAFIGTTTDNATVMITNCTRSTAFINTASTACVTTGYCTIQHAASSGPTPGNGAMASVGFNYGYESELIIPATTSYYVANSQRCAAGAGGGACPSYSLYRKVGTQAPEEIANNVGGMSVLYYVDTGTGLGSGNEAYTAANVPDMTKVVELRADFLIVSAKPVLPSNQAYPAPFNAWMSADRMAKRVLSLKINLRNTQS